MSDDELTHLLEQTLQKQLLDPNSPNLMADLLQNSGIQPDNKMTEISLFDSQSRVNLISS